MKIINADWPAPKNIVAFTTTRIGGVSSAPYNSLNLAAHVKDNRQNVTQNRQWLIEQQALPNEPAWLKQTHSNITVKIEKHYRPTEADASYTDLADRVCAVLTADCLPILMCNTQGTEIAAIHAGWRGLTNGIIENAVHKLQTKADDILVWLGPAISAAMYEVGDEMRDAFLKNDAQAKHAFTVSRDNHWYADLYMLAKQRLQKLNIHAIYGGNYCTYSQSELFYSHRRDGQTRRIASLIYMKSL